MYIYVVSVTAHAIYNLFLVTGFFLLPNRKFLCTIHTERRPDDLQFVKVMRI